MNVYTPQALSRAVAAICPDIQSRIENVAKPDERVLWWELSTCVLSSQVPYPLAVAAANKIDKENLLLSPDKNTVTLTDELIGLLSAPLNVEGRLRKYRFPETRSHHLASTRKVITDKHGSLSNLVEGFEDAAEARSWLIQNMPGVGPKQSSMFLRNIGVSYELAILDRHVLNYMSALGIYEGGKSFISGIKQYRHHETVLREHADELNCSVGLLDWAIWIVMRVANRETGALAA